MARLTKKTKRLRSNAKTSVQRRSSEKERSEFERFEFEVAQRRAQQFNPTKWEAAISHKRQMNIFTHGNYDPGPTIIKNLSKDEIGVFISDVDNCASVSVDLSSNPDKRGSFGYVGSFALISSQSSYIPGTLVLRFDVNKLGSVARNTLRLFRWDENLRLFKPVFTSGVANDDRNYVWGRITLPGKYAIIGLHSHPLVVRTAKISAILSDLTTRLDPKIRKQLQERICKLILHSPELGQAIEKPDVLEALIRGSVEQGFPNPLNAWKPNPGFEVPDPDDICPDLPHLPQLPELPPKIYRIPDWELLDLSAKFRLACYDPGWQNVGPINISGCMIQVAVDPTDNNTIYAAGESGGLWRLDNVITHPTTAWIPLTDKDVPSLKVRAFAIAPSDNQVIYLADELGFLRRSSDRGSTWVRTSTTNIGIAYKIIVNPRNKNNLFVASNSGLWRSTTGGSTWDSPTLGRTNLPLRLGDTTDAAMDPDDPTILYIGERGSGLWKSLRNGDDGTWELLLPWSRATSPIGSTIKIAVGGRGSDVSRTVLVKFDQEVFVNHRGGRPEIMARGKRGKRWVPIFNISKFNPDELKQPVHQLNWGNVVAIDPFNNRVMFVGHLDLYRTDNGGANWNKTTGYGTTHEDQQSVVFDPTDSKYVYISNDGGVFRSKDNGKTWNDINYGLATSQFYHVGIANDVAVGNIYHSGIIGSESLMTRRWREIEGHSWEFSNIYSDPARLYTFYAFLKDSDGTVIDLWRRKYYGGSSGSKKPLTRIASFKPTAIAIDTRTSSNTLLVGSDSPGRIMRAKNGDSNAPTWTLEPGISIGADPIVSIVFAPSRPGMAYAVSSTGIVFRKMDVNNDDDDEKWQRMGQWPRNDVLQLDVNPLHENRIYLITDNDVARSFDFGRSGTWIQILGSGKTSLPASGFNSILAHHADGRTIFLAADVGVFISTDEGASWSPYGDLPNAEIEQILWGQDGYLYAGTMGRGLWRRYPCL